MKESVLYCIRCEECKKQERNVEYWGETRRDCFTRGGEHIKGCREKGEENPMWKHIWESHQGEMGDEIFTMRMEGTFRKPLARQIREGVEIELSRGILMNSKSEWNNPKIPRIVIESGEEQIEDQESGLGKKGESEKRGRRNKIVEKIQVRNQKRRVTDASLSTTEGEEILMTREKRQRIDKLEEGREPKVSERKFGKESVIHR